MRLGMTSPVPSSVVFPYECFDKGFYAKHCLSLLFLLFSITGYFTTGFFYSGTFDFITIDVFCKSNNGAGAG